ncbi:MAG: sialidase family protein [Planctomycetota bacterium]
MHLPSALRSAGVRASILVLASAAVANAQTVREAERLNTTGVNLDGGNRIDGAVIAVRGTTFYAAWTEQFGTTEFTQDIYFASSTDDGASWSVPVRIDLGDVPNEFDSDQPKIAVAENGNVVVIWEEKRDARMATPPSNNEDVFYNVSTDGGLTWLPAAQPLNIPTSGLDVATDVDRLWLCASGDTFHVTWEDQLTAGGDEEVFYTRSLDGGLTWEAPFIVNAATAGQDVDEPKVEADGDLVIVAYIDVDADAVIHRSTDRGATFGPAVKIEADTSGAVNGDITLEVRGDTVVVAYTEDNGATVGGEEIVVSVSNDGGATWRADETLSVQQAAIAGSDADRAVATIQSANNIYVVYSEDSLSVQAGTGGGSGGNECYVAYTNDGGATWVKDVPLNAGNAGNRPWVVSTDDVVVAWIELNANGSNAPAFTYSLDAGTTWMPVQAVTNVGPDIDEGAGSNEGRYLAISPVSNTTMATFMDRPLGNNEVYTAGFLLSIDIGANYCTAVANSTGATGSIGAQGSRQVSDNALQLIARDLPQNAFGFFLTSQQQGFVSMPGGSQGNLCLGGAIGRYVGAGQIKNSGGSGTFMLDLDLTQTPTPTGLVAILPGETWNFTTWHRDSVAGQATSNFTNGVQIDFL